MRDCAKFFIILLGVGPFFFLQNILYFWRKKITKEKFSAEKRDLIAIKIEERQSNISRAAD